MEWEKEQEQWTQMQFGTHHNSSEGGTVEMSGCGSHTMAWNTEKLKHPQEKKDISCLSPVPLPALLQKPGEVVEKFKQHSGANRVIVIVGRGTGPQNKKLASLAPPIHGRA